MKKLLSWVMNQLSKLGRAMFVPLAATPIAGLLARISASDMLNLPMIENVSWVVFSMMDLLFAIGSVMAYAKVKDKAIPIIGAIVSLEVFKSVLSFIDPSIDMGVFAGILVGVMTAIVFNYSKEWKIPEIFIFFRGEKLVVTLAPLVAIVLANICSYVWLPIQSGLNDFGVWIASAGAIGIFIYGLLNRLLIPTGLHHVLNSYIYYELGTFVSASGEVVKGELPRFLAGDPTAGLFLAMFFIPMMFGLPGVCHAIYKKAKVNKQKIKAFMFSSAITSFISGITEPIEFSFMFVAPQLYILHAFFTGFSGVILYLMNVHLGISVNFCVIDYIMNFNMGQNAWIIIPVGIFFFFLYDCSFQLAIEHFDLKTPGREDNAENQNIEKELEAILNGSQYQNTAENILKYVGGKANVIDVEACTTRLRIELKNTKLVNEEKLKQCGSKGIMRFGEHEIQIIIGANVNKIAREFKELLD
ncbi:PTS system, glucose-like IIB component [Candidatus Stoquefichus sp. KLE1796]|nr:PTS system, glucose-like IIB component [Candidatus Stoquefichus sp. KLE1796]